MQQVKVLYKIDSAAAARLYVGGMSMVKIAQDLGFSRNTVSTALDREGVILRDRRRNAKHDKEICDLYQKGVSTDAIAVSFNVSVFVVRRALYRNNITVKHGSDYRRTVITKHDEIEIVGLYTETRSSNAVSKTLGIPVNVVINTLRKYNVQLRKTSARDHSVSECQLKQAIKLYEERGFSIRAIANELKLSFITIQRAFKFHNIKPDRRRSKMLRRQKNGNYYSVILPSDHPFASMCQSDGKVLEHRFIMAETLGRPLYVNESVHHINGNKYDNRAENLQLRTGQHGSGVVCRCVDCGSYNIISEPLS